MNRLFLAFGFFCSLLTGACRNETLKDDLRTYCWATKAPVISTAHSVRFLVIGSRRALPKFRPWNCPSFGFVPVFLRDSDRTWFDRRIDEADSISDGVMYGLSGTAFVHFREKGVTQIKSSSPIIVDQIVVLEPLDRGKVRENYGRVLQDQVVRQSRRKKSLPSL